MLAFSKNPPSLISIRLAVSFRAPVRLFIEGCARSLVGQECGEEKKEKERKREFTKLNNNFINSPKCNLLNSTSSINHWANRLHLTCIVFHSPTLLLFFACSLFFNTLINFSGTARYYSEYGFSKKLAFRSPLTFFCS